MRAATDKFLSHNFWFKPYPPVLCAICCVAFGGVDCVVRHCCAPFVVLRLRAIVVLHLVAFLPLVTFSVRLPER